MPVPYKNKPFNRSFMREEVYKTMLTWIMDGELRPGEKLLDKELAESMGVSRTPVREAIRQLEADGLVTHLRDTFPRRKYLGIELEVNQARLAAPGPSRQLARLIAESLVAVLPPAR